MINPVIVIGVHRRIHSRPLFASMRCADTINFKVPLLKVAGLERQIRSTQCILTKVR